jgi:hypothetical protein
VNPNPCLEGRSDNPLRRETGRPAGDRRRALFATARIKAAGLVAWLVVGCTPGGDARLNAPPQGHADLHHPMSEYYAYHNDAGMMGDLSIADLHFIPHSADLSGSGVARLERYAELLASSGGTIRYDPTIHDEKLIQARLTTAQEYLKQVVPGAQPVSVAVGMTGGRGMTAKESMEGLGVARKAEERRWAYRLNVAKGQGQGTSK